MTGGSAHCVAAEQHGYSGAGFTVLELLVAMTLLIALSLLLFSGLRFGARAWDRAEADRSNTEDSGVVQSFLRRELTDAYPDIVTPDISRREADFEGMINSLNFIAPAPAALAQAGFSQFALHVVVRDGENELDMDSRFELSREDFPSPVGSVTLLRGFRRLSFAYFGAEKPFDAPAWHDTWTHHASLPQLIRLRVEFPDGDRRSWPDLVVAPSILVDANCLYDPVTRGCRGR